MDKKLEPINTEEKAAEAVGLGRGSIARLTHVFNAAESGDNRARELMEELDSGKRTINSAYTVFRLVKKRNELQTKIRQETQTDD